MCVLALAFVPRIEAQETFNVVLVREYMGGVLWNDEPRILLANIAPGTLIGFDTGRPVFIHSPEQHAIFSRWEGHEDYLQRSLLAPLSSLPVSDSLWTTVMPGYDLELTARWSPTFRREYPIIISPSEQEMERGDTQQFTASNESAIERFVWSVEGNTSPNTTITEGGVLTVAPDELAATLTVRAEWLWYNQLNARFATAEITLPCPDCGNTPCVPCDDCEKCPCECCPNCEKYPCECIDAPTPNSGIDYTPWLDTNHLIVSSTSTDTATINLTTETIDLAGFVPTQFSINGGQRWRNVRADGTTFATRFPAMLNRGMTLHIRDSSEEGATIITFPQINRRPRAPRVQINFLKDHDPTGQTPGYWLLTDRPRRGTQPTVQRDASIQLAVPATETRPNGRVRVLNTANELGWGQFFNGEGDRGIPVLPLPESNRVTRTRYLVRLAPTQEADNTFTPASRTGRVNVSSERRPTRLSVRERTATANREASATLRVRANTFVQLPGQETPTLHEARIDINVLEVSGNIYVWQAAAVNGRRPASARQIIAR